MTKSVHFEPVHRARYITVDPFGNIFEVTNMYDRNADATNDPALAVSCVVALPGDRWWSTTTDDVPIYTVH